MRRSARKVLWLLAVLAAGTALGRAQPNTAASEAPATFSLVDGREPMTLLSGVWRFQPGDDARYSQAGFDDSHWALLQSDRSWSEQGYKGLAGYAWYRFKIVLPPSSSGNPKFSMLLPPIHTIYQCFVDGRLVRTVGQFPPDPNVLYRAAPVIVALPDTQAGQARPVQVALRVWHSPIWVMYTGGGVAKQQRKSGRVGIAASIKDYYDTTHVLKQHQAMAGLFLSGLQVLAAIVSLALYFFRRSEREYLWFAVGALSGITLDVISYGQIDRISSLRVLDTFYNVAGTISLFAVIALFKAILRGKVTRLFRVAIGAALLDIALFFPADYWNVISVGASLTIHSVLVLPTFAWIVLLTLRRLREGMPDAWLLLIPMAFGISLSLVNLTALTMRTFGHPIGFSGDGVLFEYPFPIQASNVSDAGFLLAMLAILLNRFSRTNREQERVNGEMQAARSLQQVLIPETIPEISGLKISAAYHPANEVGGDFFQVVPLRLGETLVVLGDVSGKGLAAAMTVSLAVGAIRTLAEQTDSPGEILAGLNRRLCGRGGFTTCLALRFSSTGAMTIANAGHIAPYLNGREVETEPALPLGLDFDAVFAEKTVQLRGNDQLTILTDGVPEAENHKELFGFARTENLSTQGASYIADAAREFGQNDDITVVTLTMLPVGAVDA